MIQSRLAYEILPIFNWIVFIIPPKKQQVTKVFGHCSPWSQSLTPWILSPPSHLRETFPHQKRGRDALNPWRLTAYQLAKRNFFYHSNFHPSCFSRAFSYKLLGWFACLMLGQSSQNILSQVVVPNGDESHGIPIRKRSPKNKSKLMDVQDGSWGGICLYLYMELSCI